MAVKEDARRASHQEGQMPRTAREPLPEGRMGPAGSFYLHVSDPSHALGLFRQSEAALAGLGYSCSRGGLQTEPHPTLSVLDSFDLYLTNGRRQPELFGTVTLYGTVEGGRPQPRSVKYSPVYPADAETLLRAMGAAIETAIPRFSAESPERDIAIAVNGSPEHSFAK
jgi:hypothetical protein